MITTLVLCTILGTSIAGYLQIVSQQTKLSSRSQSWNLAISIAEAGIEEGLEHLNSSPSSLGSNGWSYTGSAYSVTRTLANGNSYSVFITNSATPTIYARADVVSSVFVKNTPSVVFAAAGMGGTLGAPVSRAVVVTCKQSGLIAKGMVAKGVINMNGNNIVTDSFDSGDPHYSNNGQYDSTRVKDNGDVASNDTIRNSVNAGNANIYGHVATGPGGTVSVGSQGSIGTHAWAQAGNNGIEPGWVSDNSNFTFPDTSLPYSSGFTPSSGTIVTSAANVTSSQTSSSTFPSPLPAGGVTTNIGSITTKTLPSPIPAGTTTNVVSSGPQSGRGTWYTYPVCTYQYSLYTTNISYATNHYDNIIYSGDYYAASLTGSTIVLGSARLVLPNGLNMSGGDSITIASGGTIQVYAGGTSVAVGGNGVMNQPGLAANFIVYCAPTVTSFSLSGNAGFTGVLVAPNADIRLNGGGNNTVDFIGSLVANSITLNGHFNFHYDEALSRLSANGRFLVATWNEAQP